MKILIYCSFFSFLVFFCGCKKESNSDPVAALSSINCVEATNTGTLIVGSVAVDVISLVPYVGGNGGTYPEQTVLSTGVTGLTAKLIAGKLEKGNGSLTFTITGTPNTSGTASFDIMVGGQTCTLNRIVNLPAASLTSVNCTGATNNGTLIVGSAASGVSSLISYTGGNGGTFSAQNINSTGVTGLTATLTAGTLQSGTGSLTYVITGTPITTGTASFNITIGGQSCSLNRIVDLPAASLSSINCTSPTNNGTLTMGSAASGVSSVISYTGGNGGTYSAQSINSTGVNGLTATLSAGTLGNGNGNVTYTITGTPATGGVASFAINLGGKSCTLTRIVNITTGTGISMHSCGATNVHNSAISYGSMMDQEGNQYRTVVIGNRTWMAENLKTTKYKNGDAIQNVTGNTQWASLTTGAYCSYNNNTANDCPYGKYYNWFAVNDNRGLCPTGWHVPNDAEWIAMVNTLDPNANGGNIFPNTAGGKMKSTGSQYWIGNVNASNSSGFSGLPGSLRNETGLFYGMGDSGGWRGATELDATKGLGMGLLSSTGFAYRGYDFKLYGMSVRCIKD